MKKLVILGGGPAGLNLAMKCAKEFRTIVIEEHAEIGLPVQCTGLITESIEAVLPELAAKIKKEAAINSIRNVRIYSPDRKFLEIEFRKENLILQRDRFDLLLKEAAEDSGAEIMLNSRAREIRKRSITVKKKEVGFDFLAGADGPRSIVRKYLNPSVKTEFFTGIQARIKLKEKTANSIDFYPFVRDIAWSVPESEDIVRVGVMKKSNPLLAFRDFTKRFDGKMLDIQAGMIPVYDRKITTAAGSIFLLGDAAGQVKATTGGGIIPGLRAGNMLADSLKNRGGYEKKWRKTLGKELWLHLKIREILNRFSEKDWNGLIKDFQNEKLKNVLEETSRDEIVSMIARLLIRKPQLLKYGTRLL